MHKFPDQRRLQGRPGGRGRHLQITLQPNSWLGRLLFWLVSLGLLLLAFSLSLVLFVLAAGVILALFLFSLLQSRPPKPPR